MKINEVIRAKRLELGMTQEQVAMRLGVSTPAVNKWERGASYPDITLIPALARLLKTDANTLLSFQEDITQEQNIAIQREADRLVREGGYDAGFRYAVDAMREYPACNQLACILTMYLDGALSLYGEPECADADGVGATSSGKWEEYRSTIDANYRRLASSAEPAVREMATGMLIAQAMKDEDYEQAQELVDTLPDAAPYALEKEGAKPPFTRESAACPRLEAYGSVAWCACRAICRRRCRLWSKSPSSKTVLTTPSRWRNGVRRSCGSAMCPHGCPTRRCSRLRRPAMTPRHALKFWKTC